MRKFSLVLAAAVMAVGLAVSGGASATDDAHKILSEGEILMKSSEQEPEGTAHRFTVAHDGKIYRCVTYVYRTKGSLYCWRLAGEIVDLN